MRVIRRRIKKQTRLIFDCNAIGYAAFHSYGDLEDDHGNPTAVIYGFLRVLLTIQEKLKGKAWIFCWDSRRNFRKEIDSQYKVRRGNKDNKTDEEIMARRSAHEQFVRVRKEILPALGFNNNFICPGYEGDDLMAHLLDRKNPYRDMLCTSDNDMFQCLDLCDIYHLATKRIITSVDFEKKFDIEVSQWAEAKAIGGCSGDDVIGIEGVADPKSTTSKALKYLRGELNKGKILDKIESKAGRRRIALNRRLVTLPLKYSPAINISYRPDRLYKEDFLRLFEKHRFISLLESKMFNRYMEAFNVEEKKNAKRTIRRRHRGR